jgi:hypothetical protein
MNAAAAAAMSSFCFRLFLFNDILSVLLVLRLSPLGNAASEDAFQQDTADARPTGTCGDAPDKVLAVHTLL